MFDAQSITKRDDSIQIAIRTNDLQSPLNMDGINMESYRLFKCSGDEIQIRHIVQTMQVDQVCHLYRKDIIWQQWWRSVECLPLLSRPRFWHSTDRHDDLNPSWWPISKYKAPGTCTDPSSTTTRKASSRMTDNEPLSPIPHGNAAMDRVPAMDATTMGLTRYNPLSNGDTLTMTIHTTGLMRFMS